MSNSYPEVQTNGSICEGLCCSEPASNTIQVNIDKKSAISLYLCDNCVKSFHNTETCNKKALERQIDLRACPNTSAANQTSQQRGDY